MPLDVAEVLRDGQPGQPDPQPRPWRLGHLAVDQCRFGLVEVVGIHDPGLLHFQPEVIALARALAHAREHRNAAVLQRDVVDQLHDDHGLADAGTAEQADLAALQVGLDQVHDLDSGLEDLRLRGLLGQLRRIAVDGQRHLGLDRPALVDRLSQHVEHASQHLGAHGHRDGPASVGDVHAAHQPVGRLHGQGAHSLLAQVLLHLACDPHRLGHVEALAADNHCIEELWQAPAVEPDVDGRAGHLDDFPYGFHGCDPPGTG